MPDWACQRCGNVNLDGQRACEGCGREREGAKPIGPKGGHVVKSTPLPGNRPCTEAQNKAALKITQDVQKGLISADVGRRRMVELFGMPELEHER